MSFFTIQVHINNDRVAEGQPATELIELDNVVNLPQLLWTSYAETKRFSDYRRKGGASIRYYHLMEYSEGTCVGVSENLDRARLLRRFYLSRAIFLPDFKQLCIADTPRDEMMSSLSAASAIRVQLLDSGYIIASPNCIEFYEDRISILSSLRLPEALFHHSNSKQSLEDKISEAESSRYSYYISELQCPTIDARLTVEISINEEMQPSTCYLELTYDRHFELLFSYIGIATK